MTTHATDLDADIAAAWAAAHAADKAYYLLANKACAADIEVRCWTAIAADRAAAREAAADKARKAYRFAYRAAHGS